MAVILLLSALNVVGIREAAGVNIVLALVDLVTQLILVVVGVVLVLSPETLVENIDFGTYPTVTDFLIAIPIGMIAFTGIETISNMAEEARDYGSTIPKAMRFVVLAVIAGLRLPALSGAVCHAGRERAHAARPRRGGGGCAGDPVLGVVENMDLGASHGSRRDLRRRARRDDPLHRHERWDHRRLPPHVLHGAVPPAPGACARAAPAVSNALHRDRRLRPGRVRDAPPRTGRVPRDDLRLRRDAVFHDRAPGRDRAAAEGTRPGAPLPRPWLVRLRGRELPLFAVVGGIGTFLSWVAVTALNIETLFAGTVWMVIGLTTYVLYRRHQELSLTETHKVVTPKPVVEHEVEYESILVAFEDNHYSPEAVSTAVARGPPAPRHPCARDDHGAAELADRRRHAGTGGKRVVDN